MNIFKQKWIYWMFIALLWIGCKENGGNGPQVTSVSMNIETRILAVTFDQEIEASKSSANELATYFKIFVNEVELNNCSSGAGLCDYTPRVASNTVIIRVNEHFSSRGNPFIHLINGTKLRVGVKSGAVQTFGGVDNQESLPGKELVLNGKPTLANILLRLNKVQLIFNEEIILLDESKIVVWVAGSQVSSSGAIDSSDPKVINMTLATSLVENQMVRVTLAEAAVKDKSSLGYRNAANTVGKSNTFDRVAPWIVSFSTHLSRAHKYTFNENIKIKDASQFSFTKNGTNHLNSSTVSLSIEPSYPKVIIAAFNEELLERQTIKIALGAGAVVDYNNNQNATNASLSYRRPDNTKPSIISVSYIHNNNVVALHIGINEVIRILDSSKIKVTIQNTYIAPDTGGLTLASDGRIIIYRITSTAGFPNSNTVKVTLDADAISDPSPDNNQNVALSEEKTVGELKSQ